MDADKARIVLDGLQAGKSLRASAAEAKVAASTVLDWAARYAEFGEQYARAREVGYKLLADEIIEIADDSSGDAMVDEDGKVKQNAEFVNRARLRVDTRKWMLAKMLPKVYGERIEHQHRGDFKVEISPTEAKL